MDINKMEQEKFDPEWDMKLYLEKLKQAQKIAAQTDLKLTTDNIVSIATTLYITVQQKIRSKY